MQRLTVFLISGIVLLQSAMAQYLPAENDVKAVTDRVLTYIDKATPARLVDSRTRKEITDFRQIDRNTCIDTGDFKLVCYEWGVTYSAVLEAWKTTGDRRYLAYLDSRLRLLSDAAPYFDKVRRNRIPVDKQMGRLLAPHSLDDSGALCAAMIKARLSDASLPLDSLIMRLADCVLNKQQYLSDGLFCRNFPQYHSVWLDDMFMGVPAMAWMGRYMRNKQYYDRAVKMIRLFRDHMFVDEEKLFRHGWVEDMNPHRFFPWGRANGWAILTLCEVLDALPEQYPGREELINLYRRHVEGITAWQATSGFWHQLINRPDTYEETSATAIFTYALAHGINKGWIDTKAYGPQTLSAWRAVSTAVDAEGRVTGTCIGTGMGFTPGFYQERPVSTKAAHGYGPVIWAGAEIIKMLRTAHPHVNDAATHFYRHKVENKKGIFRVDKP